MSTSPSLATSADLETIPTTSFHDVADLYASSSASYSIGERLARHHRRQWPSTMNFYEQVDERMSRNSCEYPAHQAKYVDHWLTDNKAMNAGRSGAPPAPSDISDESSLDHYHEKSSSEVRDQWGNIIGIRGYPKGPADCSRPTSQEQRRQHQATKSNRQQATQYNRLKFEQIRLKSSNEKLRKQIESLARKFKRQLKSKDLEIELLRGARIGRSNQPPPPPAANLASPAGQSSGGEDSSPAAEGQLGRRRPRLPAASSREQADREEAPVELLERQESARLRRELARVKSEHEQELRALRLELERLAVQPEQALWLELKNENSRLRATNEADGREFQLLREKYQQLERELNELLSESNRNELGKEGELARVSLELSRAQVYQRKLESILDTERAIKLELERQLAQLRSAEAAGRERLAALQAELARAQARSERAVELAVRELRAESTRWQEKCDRLEREKADLGELLRQSRRKLDDQAARQEHDLERLIGVQKRELAELSEQFQASESSARKLELKLVEMQQRAANCEMERNQLIGDNLELNRQLAAAAAAANSSSEQRKGNESDELQELRTELRQSETGRRELASELADLRDRNQLIRQQLDELRARFKLQQESFDRMRETKERELSRLRVNLNFERYQRQLAVGSIEKELRNSLRELDSMKCRFERRFQSAGASPSASSSSPPSSSSVVAAAAAAAPAGCSCGCGFEQENRDRSRSPPKPLLQANVIETKSGQNSSVSLAGQAPKLRQAAAAAAPGRCQKSNSNNSNNNSNYSNICSKDNH